MVADRVTAAYYPSHHVANTLAMSGKALSRITSSFMVLTEDGQKVNLGLSLKFEAKGQKVLEYSRKDGLKWEFSDKAIELIREYRVRVSLEANFYKISCLNFRKNIQRSSVC